VGDLPGLADAKALDPSGLFTRSIMKKNQTIDRRKFLQSLSTGTLGLAAIPVFSAEKSPP
jgi:hypothetical protein